MTGRREPDTDSGFIGSMVGSEVSAGNLSSRRQPPQSPLRLRHPGDLPANQQRLVEKVLLCLSCVVDSKFNIYHMLAKQT